MNTIALRTAALMCLGIGVQAGCAQPLDLCADQAGTCLTVEATSDSTGSVDLLRALYAVSPAPLQERQFAGPAGGSVLPIGFTLTLPTAGAVSVNLIAESALQPVLRGSGQATLAPGDHQLLTIPLTPDLSNLPYAGPPPRHHAGVVFSPASQSVVLFGGTQADGSVLGDTWELDSTGTTWTARGSGRPTPPARNATLAYDSLQSLVILAGGSTSAGAPLQDMWTFDTTGTWTQQQGNFGGGARINAGMTVDNTGTVIIAGGQDPAGNTLLDILTAAPLKATLYPDFMPHAGSQPLPKVKSPKLAYVAMTGGVYLLGVDEAAPTGTSSLAVWQILGSFMTTTFPLSVVALPGSQTNAPSARTDYSMAVDSSGGLIYLFGGISAQTGQYLQDAYVFDVQLRQWAMISPSTPTLPLPRAGAQLALLPQSLLLFGGMAAPGGPTAITLDSWTLPPGAFAMPTVSAAYTRHL